MFSLNLRVGEKENQRSLHLQPRSSQEPALFFLLFLPLKKNKNNKIPTPANVTERSTWSPGLSQEQCWQKQPPRGLEKESTKRQVGWYQGVSGGGQMWACSILCKPEVWLALGIWDLAGHGAGGGCPTAARCKASEVAVRPSGFKQRGDLG